MLHTVPRIDDPESMFGYTRSGTSQDYILLGPPSPIRGPTFEKYGDSCVGAYVVRAGQRVIWPRLSCLRRH